jgi:outer membrane receptor for ferrienterochelin and colicins
MADLSISKRLFKSRMILTLGCKNLFNTINVNRVGESRGTAHSTTNNSLSIGTGRSLFFGLGYQFSRK